MARRADAKDIVVMTSRGRPAAFALRAVASLLGLVGLTACSNMAIPTEDVPTTGPDPGYGNLVADRLKDSFKKLSPNDPVEISEPRWVHTMTGWSYLTCVHFLDQGHQRTYALFIKDGAIVDSRYAVETDACGGQTYSSLDLSSGAIRPRATGEQGPLY